MLDRELAQLQRKIEIGDVSHSDLERYLVLSQRSGRHSFEAEFLNCEIGRWSFQFCPKSLKKREEFDILEDEALNFSDRTGKLEDIHDSLFDVLFSGIENTRRHEEYYAGRWRSHSNYFQLHLWEDSVLVIEVEEGHATLVDLLELWRQIRGVCPHMYFSDGIELFRPYDFFEDFCMPGLLIAKEAKELHNRVGAIVWESKMKAVLDRFPEPTENFEAEDEEDEEEFPDIIVYKD